MKRWKERLIGHELTTLINQILRNIINLSFHKISEAKKRQCSTQTKFAVIPLRLRIWYLFAPTQRTDLITKCGKNSEHKKVRDVFSKFWPF